MKRSARDNGQGMFTMDFITEVSKMSLAQAHPAVQGRIDGSAATDENKQKAHAMLNKATSMKQLLLGMTNFSLAHQGLGVR